MWLCRWTVSSSSFMRSLSHCTTCGLLEWKRVPPRSKEKPSLRNVRASPPTVAPFSTIATERPAARELASHREPGDAAAEDDGVEGIAGAWSGGVLGSWSDSRGTDEHRDGRKARAVRAAAQSPRTASRMTSTAPNR
jgi:hypothetical protein